jgi:hypothetical protein
VNVVAQAVGAAATPINNRPIAAETFAVLLKRRCDFLIIFANNPDIGHDPISTRTRNL